MVSIVVERKQTIPVNLEEKAIKLINTAGKEGILQQELWKKLEIDSREGSKLVLRLIKKGLVKKEAVTVDGKRTYKLYSKKKPVDTIVDLRTLIEIPCFTCRFFKECGPGGVWNPVNCTILEEWLEEKYRKKLGFSQQ